MSARRAVDEAVDGVRDALRIRAAVVVVGRLRGRQHALHDQVELIAEIATADFMREVEKRRVVVNRNAVVENAVIGIGDLDLAAIRQLDAARHVRIDLRGRPRR